MTKNYVDKSKNSIFKSKRQILFNYSKIKSLFSFLRSEKKADSGLIITFGQRGTGKSAACSKIYYQWLKSRFKRKDFYNQYDHVYSNIEFKIDNPNYHYLDLVNFNFIDYIPINEKTNKFKIGSSALTPFKFEENSIIILDELGIIAHNRDYKNFPKEFIFFLKVIRKMGVLIYSNSQSYDVEKSIRSAASELRIQRKIGNLSFSRKLNKWIDINSGNDSSAEQQIVDKIGFAPIIQKNAIKFCYIPFYSSLYDSFS